MKMFKTKGLFCFFLIYFVLSNNVRSAESGLLARGICSAGCYAVYVACNGAAGVVIGTVTAGAGLNFLKFYYN